MKKYEQILIKLEFDRSIKYLDSKKEKLTISECMQEIGHLRMFIYNMEIEKGKNPSEEL
jgi:hypothetical protein